MNNKEIKPFQVVLFVAGVFSLLFPLTYLVKDDVFSVAGMEVRFINNNAVFTPEKKVEKKDISKIIMVDTVSIDNVSAKNQVKNNFKSNGLLGAPDGGTLSGESATNLQYSESGQASLHRLFEKLLACANGKKLRILHYGDSQIEGDRMTSYIRQKLQSQFGGNGPGTIPANNVYNTFTFKQTFSENFKRYTAFGGSSLKSRRYGSMNTAARFTPEMDSATMAATTSVKTAFIEIQPSATAYERARKFNQVKMFYTSCYKPCAIKVYKGTELIHEDSLINDGKYHVLSLDFPSTPSKLRYEYSATVSPTIIGFSLESDFGVFVDNIAMRGSSGTFFGKIDQNSCAKMYDDLNVEMIIMQFGGNTVPYLKDSSAVRNYAKQFRSQLATIKKIRPSATIVVIGPSDMSTSSINGMVSFKMIPFLTTEMKRVTKDIGGSYWDLFEAMGGLNSMPSWVEKGLAGRDYIHFSNKGASIAAQLFYDAFIAEFVKWQNGQ